MSAVETKTQNLGSKTKTKTESQNLVSSDLRKFQENLKST